MRLSTSTNIYFNRPRGEKGSLDQCIRFCGQGGYKRMDLNLVDYTNFRFPFVDSDWRRWIGGAMETAARPTPLFITSAIPWRRAGRNWTP